MKKNLQDIGGVIFDAFITIVIGIVILNILGSILVSTAFGAEEPLTKEEEVVAITVLAEARGETPQGMYAIVCVIQKRMEERKLTASQVCLEDKQFSCWNLGQNSRNINRLRIMVKGNSKEAKYSRLLARCLCKGWKFVQGMTGHANHYYSKKIMKSPPYWAYKIDKKTGKFLRDKKGNKIPLTPTKIIRNHVFYKL